jgi:hypothetical protein
MATTYSTKIDKARVVKSENGLTNVIQTVWYTIVGVSDDGYMKIYKKQLDFPSPTPEAFINIDLVTEELLISWIESQPEYLTDEDKTYFESRFTREREKPIYSDYKFSFMPYDELRYNLIN